PGGEELGVDAAAAFDHEPTDTAPGEVGEHAGQVEPVAGADDGGEPTEGVADSRDDAVRAVDGLLAPVVPEPQLGVHVTAPGDGDLEWMLGPAARHPGGPAFTRVDHQPRVVPTHGGSADQDGVAAGAQGVDPVEVLGVGQQQPVGAGVVDVAVDGHRAAQQHVR